ncbi:MAG: hypothetical protein AAF808_03220 [Cyanobacteria bacterium P01_D01_bin.2]
MSKGRELATLEVATTSEAQGGTATDGYMTPKLVADALASLRAFATQAEAEAGVVANKVLNPVVFAAALETLCTTLIEAAVPGYNQRWVDVAASRAADTVYTNTDGKPRKVVVSMLDDAQFQVREDASSAWVALGTIADSDQDSGSNKGELTIPVDAQYRVVGGFNAWEELVDKT